VKTIPIINLSSARKGDEAARRDVARQIDEACCEIGFFAIEGHGVPESTVGDLHRAGHDFFSLPLAVKQAAVHPAGMNRGYHQIGGETLANANDHKAPPDLKEFFHVGPVRTTDAAYFTSEEGRRHFAPNIWPAGSTKFRDAAINYYEAMSKLIMFLMRLAALALDMEEHYFDDKVDRSIGAMRLNYYPAQTEPPRQHQLRASAHTDYGGFTILSGEDTAGGLQVRGREGQWIDVKTTRNVFVVNIGDLLMRWTNDRWLSNLHRVINPQDDHTDGGRLSIAFFNQPNYDALIQCLPSLSPAKYLPVLSGDYRDLKYQKTGLTSATGSPLSE